MGDLQEHSSKLGQPGANDNDLLSVQMHVVLKDTAQDTKGYITVVVRDIELIKRRLNAIEEALKGTKFRCA